MSFVGHIEVKESPSKTLKINQLYIHLYIFCLKMIFLHITQDQEAFQD